MALPSSSEEGQFVVCAYGRLEQSESVSDSETNRRITIMAVYTCSKCGMSIGSMTCGQCDKELSHSTITTADGETVHVSECPDGHGKVKSPMCCGNDMVCEV